MFRYFSFYPTTDYVFTTGENPKTITNILRRIKVINNVRDNISIYHKVRIQDGDTPEILANKVYGDTGLWWVILYINNIINPYYDWPLTIFDLRSFTTQKYGSGNETGVHHYEDGRGFEVNVTAVGAVVVTNEEFEDRENEKLRNVQVLDRSFIPDFIREYKEIIK